MPVGTDIGRGGSFWSCTTGSIPADKACYAWKFMRATGHKRDNADMANGFLLWANPAIQKPKPMCLDEIEKQSGNDVRLYAHSITRGTQRRVTICPVSTSVWWVAERESIDDLAFGTVVLGQF